MIYRHNFAQLALEEIGVLAASLDRPPVSLLIIPGPALVHLLL